MIDRKLEIQLSWGWEGIMLRIQLWIIWALHLGAYSLEWIKDCLYWRGRILTGKYGHWCPDWDFLPVDETCEEWIRDYDSPPPRECRCGYHA